MKKKILISLALFAVVTTLGIVMNLSETQCNHSLNGHDCSEHLTQAMGDDNRCAVCFRYPNANGLCPTFDYADCPRCGEHHFNQRDEICEKCGYYAGDICQKCQVNYSVCGCPRIISLFND